MKRILHILPQFQPGGGMERVVMNYFSHIDHNKYIFDIVTHKMDDSVYAEQILKNGGNVFLLDPLSIKTIEKNKKAFEKILINHHYDVVHCHMANAAFLYMKLAKQYNIELRILHSHQDHYADSWTHALRNIPLIHVGKRYANLNIACSYKSGKFLFGDSEFIVLHNAVDANFFSFSEKKREEWRKDLGLHADQIVYGSIGRFTLQKNQKFVLDVFKELRGRNNNSKLVMVGDGELEDELKLYAKKLKIYRDVIWLHQVHDMSQVYSGLDVLLFPSVYEGLPMVLVEAQAAGLPCFVSDTITSEAFITDHIFPISISDGVEPWVKTILSKEIKRGSIKEDLIDIQKNNFDITFEEKKLEKIYAGVLE